MNILPVSELRKNISSVLKEVEETGEPVFIVQYSNPRAVLVNYEVFNQLVKDMEELEALRAKVSGPRRSK